MPFLPSIANEDKVPHVLGKFNANQGSRIERPLIELHQALLRGPSPFSVQQRELLAAYVSGLNSCRYCYGAHAAVAQQFGVPEQQLLAMFDDIDNADLEPALLPVFAYVRKLTQTPTRMTQTDADLVFKAGWSERALYDAVVICCLYNFMNRFVEGLGLTPVPEQFAAEGRMISEGGYAAMLDAFGIH